MKYSFIAQYKKTWPIGMMCRLMGVTRSGFYHYQKHTANKPEDPGHQEILHWVKKIAQATDDSYGSRRMKTALNLLGFQVNRDKARKLMKEAGVAVKHKKKYKVTTDSNHQQPVFDNLLNRDFSAEQPDQVYAADVTYGVPGVQSRKGNRNEPQTCLKSIYHMTGVMCLWLSLVVQRRESERQ